MKPHWIAAALAPLLAATPGLAQEGAAPSPCGPGVATDMRWVGNGLMRGGKGYVATPMGQVHYRLAGPATGPVLLLLHQTPWSMNEFAEVQACLAARHVRSLAIDTPGYGNSDPPPGTPSVADYADNLVPVLDALGLPVVVAAGHHTGAAIAAALAARHPTRVAALILHGVPLYTPTERAERLGKAPRAQALSADGSHLGDYYRYILGYAGDDPHARVTATWSVIDWFLAGSADIAHDIVFRNDMGADLARIAVPVLILSDGKDSLHANDRRAAALRLNFRYRDFSDGTPHAMMIHPDRWADIAAAFVAETATR